MALYDPYFQQDHSAFAHFFVRTRGSPETIARKVDETLAGLDAAAAVETHSMGEIFAGALLPSRLGAAILGSMALFGLMLASIGLYGVLLFAIQQRTREIGIRVALGATPGDVLGMAFDREIEPPILADTSLPEVLRFAVLLGTQ
jgi:putative ABC transport system permease protein